MAKSMSLTWWGRQFIEALESITDAGRLQRGRSYAGDDRILDLAIKGSQVLARVRGNKNPYYGVYTEPRYQVEIQLSRFSDKAWQQVIRKLASNTGWLTRLLQGEMPDDIAAAFTSARVNLLPATGRHLQADCSCPDFANPCKHIAGVYYRLASLIDQDPFLLLQLRGMPRDKLREALSATPLGSALVGQMDEEPALPEIQQTLYPQVAVEVMDEGMGYREFWRGGPLPRLIERDTPSIPALAIRREGDRPRFWNRESSFIEVMSELYRTVESKNKESL